MRIFFVLFLVVLFFPVFANAQVLINEIAWMGSVNSANEEWLELYNSGAEDADISGWILESQDGSPKINLSGVIKQNGYFLLERTSDNSAPNVEADLIYTGAMSNSGEVLVLKNAMGMEIDRVDGSNDWENIGGDNATKETAQKSGTAWITAISTPMAQTRINADSAQIDADTIQKNTDTLTRAGNVKANAGGNIVAQVGQNIFFDASQSEGKVDSFSWNMGNGEVKDGKSFLYNYSFPGKYLVTLFVKNGVYESKDQIDVTIYPAGVYISEFFVGEEGWVEIYNGSENFISLSGWQMGNGGDIFTMPKGTLISSDGYLVFSSKIIGIDFIKNSGELDLIYPNGQVADKVEYQNKNAEFSASRKNKDDFVWTEYKTPGFENITASQSEDTKPDKVGQVKTDIGVSKNMIQGNNTSFVKVNGERSFLVTPAYAKVADEKVILASIKADKELTANTASLFSWRFIYLAILAILFSGFLLYKKSKS